MEIHHQIVIRVAKSDLLEGENPEAVMTVCLTVDVPAPAATDTAGSAALWAENQISAETEMQQSCCELVRSN